jgi:cullin-associated NEDD8-dissociated protein 1
VLNATNIRKFYEVDGKYVYRIQNLPIVDTPSPCTKSSCRFVRKTDTAGCTSDSSGSFPTIRTAIENFLNNVPVRDQGTKRVVDLPETPWDVNQRCTDSSNTATGKSFTVTLPGGGLSCWTHSYPWEWSVLVMNNWVLNHPGNPSKFRASKVNPIAESADRDPNLGNLESSVTISYPSWHNDNFHNNRWQFDVDRIGNWGDK